MYSPFRNEQGQPKSLDEVAYADLAQLKDLEEGFALEFKRTWNENVRAKIPKIIASFANSHGGWLVIGIADDNKTVCPVPKQSADFSQIFGELCRHHVSPTPRFDTRFIADPANPKQGAVVVQVHEGDFPPYVADGIVEIREGSTSGPALGSALVELYRKATKRKQASSVNVPYGIRRTPRAPHRTAPPPRLPCPCLACTCTEWAVAPLIHPLEQLRKAMSLP